jgi:hypothetical protein
MSENKKAESWFTVRTLSQEDFDKEFPDDELEQENPSTDVGEDEEEEESKESKETSDALVDAFKRVAKGQTLKPKLEVTSRPANQPEPAPEATQTASATSDRLAAAIRKARGMA